MGIPKIESENRVQDGMLMVAGGNPQLKVLSDSLAAALGYHFRKYSQ